MTDMPPEEQKPSQPADQPIRIPVDTPAPSPRGTAAPDVDQLVREYERKYQGFRDDESAEVKNTATYFIPKIKKQPTMPMRTGSTTDTERMWAAIAHASALLTLLIGIPTAGVSALITLFIPLMIYFYFREKSEFVAYHALQAFALQIIGTVGWVAILAVGMLVGALLIVVLAITIVGVLVIPFVVLAMILFAVASLALPLGMVVFGALGAWESYQGNWYRYPYIGAWLDQQMRGGFLTHF